MLRVGYRIRLSSGKGPDREGVVTALVGSMLRVRWPSQEETIVIPGPGTLTVLASSGDDAPSAVPPRQPAPKKAVAKKAITRKTGARGLRSIMEIILLETMFELPSLHGVEEVVINKEVVAGSARPLMIYAERTGDERAG